MDGMTSLASTTSIDKEGKDGFQPVSTLRAVDSVLPTVPEDAEDEAVKVVGYERNEVTEAEMRAVTKKIDRRVSFCSLFTVSHVSRTLRISRNSP